MNRLSVFLLSSAILFGCSSIYAQDSGAKVETYYFDKNGKGVPTKEFSDYYMVVSIPSDEHYKKMQRTYFSNGQLYSESDFLTFDKYDLTKLEMDGDVTIYFNNGVVNQKYHLDNGAFNGEYIECTNDGKFKKHAYLVAGKRNGIYTEFNDDGSAIQVEYKDDEISKPFYAYVSPNGNVSRYRVKDNKPYVKVPNINTLRTERDKSGKPWSYYVMNGITIMVNGELTSGADVSGFGKKVLQLNIVIQNNTAVPLEFNSSNINGLVLTRKGEQKSLSSINATSYAVNQAMQASVLSSINALSESMAASNAAYSTSTTQTTTNYAGAKASVSGMVGAVLSTNGAAVGAATGSSVSAWAGQSKTSSTTTTYNGYAAYQANLIASERIADYNNKLEQVTNAKIQGYLKPQMIDAGATISGFYQLEYIEGTEYNVNIPLGTVAYPFKFNN